MCKWKLGPSLVVRVLLNDVTYRENGKCSRLSGRCWWFLWSTNSRRLHQLPQLPLRVGSDHIAPASVVRDLGIYIDNDVSMRSHVAKTVSTCHAVLRQLRTIRRSVSRSVLQSLVSSLVLSRLDYGNATLVGVSSHLLSRLQSVMNAAARLLDLFFLRRSFTTLLRSCISFIG